MSIYLLDTMYVGGKVIFLFNANSFVSVTGVGYCAVFIAFYVSFYYNVIIGWSIFYFGSSFAATLPWTGCSNDWNTEFCTENCTAVAGNFDSDPVTGLPCNETRSPAKEYFK